MEKYQQLAHVPIFVKKQQFSTVPFQEKYLKLALALSFIKSSTGRSAIKKMAFAFKKIQLSSLKLTSQDSDAYLLQRRIKKNDDSISEMRHSQIHKEKSMEILRNIKSSLERQKIQHSQSAKPLFEGLNSQKNKILDQITEKLEIKNRVPPLSVEKPAEALQLNKRVAKLQTFMQQIKREREMTERPALVHQKQKINRINVHMLEEKLAQERKKNQNNDKNQEIFMSIEQIKGQIKSIQKTHESILKNAEKPSINTDKPIQISIQRPLQPVIQRRYEPKPVPVFMPRAEIPKNFHQQRQEVFSASKHLQPMESHLQPIQAPVFNFYNIVPKDQPFVPPFFIPVGNSPYAKPPNTDRVVYQNVQFSNQQMLRKPKFSLKSP